MRNAKPETEKRKRAELEAKASKIETYNLNLWNRPVKMIYDPHQLRKIRQNCTSPFKIKEDPFLKQADSWLFNTNYPGVVAKVERLHGDAGIPNFLQEVKNSLIVGRLKIAPSIVDAFICSHFSDRFGFLLMDNMNFSWADWYDYNVKNKTLRTAKKNVTKLIAHIEELLAKAHDAGIIHQDLYPKNLMGQDVKDVQTWKFIDWESNLKADAKTIATEMKSLKQLKKNIFKFIAEQGTHPEKLTGTRVEEILSNDNEIESLFSSPAKLFKPREKDTLDYLFDLLK